VRHPHRCLAGAGGELLWSHHEKIVCIDQTVAFIGGLDLCYGRMDNASHSLVDTETPAVWNGIDYSNARYRDFYEVDKRWDTDIINRNEIPRMPWHDIALRVQGKAAYDIAIHFIELWNHVMNDYVGIQPTAKELIQPVEQRGFTLPTFRTVPKSELSADTPKEESKMTKSEQL
jgi:phospholipase D1/2